MLYHEGFVLLAIILASAKAIAMEFRPPTREEALKAIGKSTYHPEREQRE